MAVRHIKLYEYFTDEIDASTRDIFGLTSSISISKNWIVEGPSENEEAARVIADDIIRKVNQLPMASVRDWSGWDDHLEYQFKSSMQEEQAALARIGWEIKWI